MTTLENPKPQDEAKGIATLRTSDLLCHDLLHILQHSLGVNQYGEGNQYRNRFVTGPGSTDWPRCLDLVNRGLMHDHGAQAICGDMHCFSVTPKGIDAVALQSPPPPKISRSKQRYRDYLRSELNMSFFEWLQWQTKKRRDQVA